MVGRRHELLQRLDERRRANQRLHRLDVEQHREVIRMLGKSRRAGQERQARPARTQRLQRAGPGALCGNRVAQLRAIGKKLNQPPVVVPSGGRFLVEPLEQVGAAVADKHGGAERNRVNVASPTRLAQPEQLEDILPGQLAVAQYFLGDANEPIAFHQRPQQARGIDRRIGVEGLARRNLRGWPLADLELGARAGPPFAAETFRGGGQLRIVDDQQPDLLPLKRTCRGSRRRVLPGTTGKQQRQQDE